MSALAHTTLSKQVMPKLSESNTLHPGTNISVTARIDYNLRFTKQAVLVVGDTTEQYSQQASQFLASLSETKSDKMISAAEPVNVAFISSSSKLNDIQIRCRLIEQLFVNTLFDPEQSLAVSVIKFAKQQGQAISIVVDHAHSLSLQVKYELCQLVSMAKKHKLTISVVLFGLTEAAQQLALNKSLFKNKLAVIEASSGQVINLNASSLVKKKHKSNLTLWHKVSLTSVVLSLIAASCWLYLLIKEDIAQQEKLIATVKIENKRNFQHALQNRPVLAGETATIDSMQQQKIILSKDSNSMNFGAEIAQATSSEIHQALLIDNAAAAQDKRSANVKEMLSAIVDDSNKVLRNDKTIATDKPAMAEDNTTKEIPNSYYYQTIAKQYPQGFVMQIAGFTDKKLLKRFLEQNALEELYHYEKMLNGKTFSVVTSKVYANKAEAKAAMLELPKQLIERKPWLKTLSSVINEINTFKE
ncbi:SPOR domain-containing protein [Colwelliaceae bacterium MEBiC 14330]